MNVVVFVPFNEGHMARIREAAGPDANVVQVLADRDKSGAVGGKKVPLAPGMQRAALPPNPVEEALQTADVVIGEPHPSLLSADLPLKWIQMTWAGTDLYTRKDNLLPEGVTLTCVAGAAYGHVISQYVVGQILGITQNLAAYVRQQPTKAWHDLGQNMSLEGARVLVYGAGDIGSHVAKRLSGFDVARITGVCRDASKPREWFDDLVTLPRAESLLPETDVVVCCLPNSPETAGYFGERRLRLMKQGSVLVNVGRGNFIDGEALDRVLNDGHLRGAALDVTDPEPLPLAHPLWRNERCVITPHISGGAFGHSVGTEERICRVCCDNLRRYRAGEPLTHRVR